MTEGWSVVGLKITKFFQEPWYLDYNSEYALICGVIVHAEAFNSFVVLNYRVEPFFFKFLPVSAEFVLVVRVEQEEKIFNIGDHLFKPEVAFSAEEVIGLFFKLANRVICAL